MIFRSFQGSALRLHPVGSLFEFRLNVGSPPIDCFWTHRVIEPVGLLRIGLDERAAPTALVGLLRIVDASYGADQMQV